MLVSMPETAYLIMTMQMDSSRMVLATRLAQHSSCPGTHVVGRPGQVGPNDDKRGRSDWARPAPPGRESESGPVASLSRHEPDSCQSGPASQICLYY